MARLSVITDEHAEENIKKSYDAITSKFKMIPNIFRGMANSPSALKAYLKLDEMIENGSFSPIEQNIVGIVVSQHNRCTYCIAAHTVALSSLGVKDEKILDIRRGKSDIPKEMTLIEFTLRVIETKGSVDDEDIDRFKKAGFSDAHTAELTLIIAHNTISNYFNHINETDLDLPPVPAI